MKTAEHTSDGAYQACLILKKCAVLLQRNECMQVPLCTGGKLVPKGLSVTHHAHTGQDASASVLPPLNDFLPGPVILFPLPEYPCSHSHVACQPSGLVSVVG